MIGLVPVNTHYQMVFERSTVGMRIVDSSGATKISSVHARELTSQQYSELMKNGSITSDPDQYLYLHALSDGMLIYQQDVSDINRMINELEQVSTELKQENTLLSRELSSRSEQASVDAKNRIYNSISGEVASQLRLIESLITSSDDTDRSLLLCKLCIIGTFVKRRCNLRLIQQEQGSVSMQELRLSLDETIKNLNTCGIPARLVWSPADQLGTDQVFSLFDLIEHTLEENGFGISSIIVIVNEKTGIIFRCDESTNEQEIFIDNTANVNISAEVISNENC